nr:MAG TPA: hypothetical protein [Caudoviricetes sp.]
MALSFLIRANYKDHLKKQKNAERHRAGRNM